MKKLVAVGLFAVVTAAGVQGADYLSNLSIDTQGAVRHVSIDGPVQYGAGLNLNYTLNKYVTGYARALSYSDFKHSAIDEGGLGIWATVLQSANKGLSLNVIGGVNRDFESEDWGFGLGLGPSVKLTKHLSVFAAAEVRTWIKQDKDILTTFGFNYKF